MVSYENKQMGLTIKETNIKQYDHVCTLYTTHLSTVVGWRQSPIQKEIAGLKLANITKIINNFVPICLQKVVPR